MTLLRRPQPEADGRYHHITPENANWKYVGFAAYDLKVGQVLTLDASDQERCLVMLSGFADFVSPSSRTAWVALRLIHARAELTARDRRQQQNVVAVGQCVCADRFGGYRTVVDEDKYTGLQF